MLNLKLTSFAARSCNVTGGRYRKLVFVVVLLLTPLLTFAQNADQKAKQVTSLKVEWARLGALKLSTGVQDTIVRIRNLRTQSDSAKINEVIAVKIATQRDINLFKDLYINGIIADKVRPIKASDSEKTVYFKLDRTAQAMLSSFLESTPFETTVVPVYFSVGAKVKVNIAVKDTEMVKDKLSGIEKQVVKDTTVQVDGDMVAKSKDLVYIEVKRKIDWRWVLAAALLVAGLAGLGLYNNMLKDNANLYYSLANTQLFYWTILFVIAYLRICFKTDALPDVPLSVLAILGISVSTTAISKVIDKNPAKAPVIDKDAKSEGLLVDILSDGASINIQRFQNVAFNAFFGVLFLQKAFSTNLLPDFDEKVLLLLGVSAGAYAGLKNTEPAKEQTGEAKDTVSDRAEEAKKQEVADQKIADDANKKPDGGGADNGKAVEPPPGEDAS